MNRFKTKILFISIFILLCVCVCAGMLYRVPAATDYDAVAALLAKHDITAEDGVFDKLPEYAYTGVTAKNRLTDREKLARAILGASANALPSASNIYMLNGLNVVFNANAFHFENNEKKDEFYFNNAADLSPESVVGKIAARLEIDTVDTLIKSEETDDGKIYTVTKTIHSGSVFDDRITIEFSGNYIKSLDGIWFEPENKGKKKHINIANALIDFMNKPDIPRPAKITELEAGYRLSDSTKQTTDVLPFLKIVIDNGSEYYIEL